MGANLELGDLQVVTLQEHAHLHVLIGLTRGGELQRAVLQGDMAPYLRRVRCPREVQIERELAGALLDGWGHGRYPCQVKGGHLDVDVERRLGGEASRARDMEHLVL